LRRSYSYQQTEKY